MLLLTLFFLGTLITFVSWNLWQGLVYAHEMVVHCSMRERGERCAEAAIVYACALYKKSLLLQEAVASRESYQVVCTLPDREIFNNMSVRLTYVRDKKGHDVFCTAVVAYREKTIGNLYAQVA